MKVNVNDSKDAWRHRPYLNDALVQYAIEADDEAGYVLVYKHQDGRVVLDEDGEPIIERLEGIVRIEPYENQS